MIKIGETLTLELIEVDEHEKYRCKLLEKEKQRIFVDYPININTNRTVYLLEGTHLRASFIGEDGAVYWFHTEVVGRLKGHIPMLILSYPEEDQLIKIQRRQYVRVETAVDVAVHPLQFDFTPFVTITEDISAGGLALYASSDIKFYNGQKVSLWLVLPMQNGEYHHLNIISKVVRSVPKDGKRNKVSFQFLDVDQNTRQILIRFCFDQQLLLRKKGLIEN